MSVINYANALQFFSSDAFFDIGGVSSCAELSLREAADVLFVSESFLMTLLDSGKIPSQGIGSQRRIKSEDLLTFKLEQSQLHMNTVDELVEEGQLFNPNY